MTVNTELRAGQPVAAAALTIIPVERLGHLRFETGTGFSVSVTKEPVAVVLKTASNLTAVDLSGTRLDIEHLFQKVPRLREVVQEL